VGTHYDQAIRGFLGCANNACGHISLSQETLGWNAGVRNLEGVQLLFHLFVVCREILLNVLPQWTCFDVFAPEHGRRMRHDVEKDQPGPLVSGERTGQLQSTGRILGEVSRMKYGLDRCHVMFS
jgi:hypothetical protein